MAAVIAWGTYSMLTKHTLPDFAGTAMLVGALYGSNRIAGAIQARVPQGTISNQIGNS